MATKTFTFPASQVYVDRSGISHVIDTSQTFTMDMTDLGTTASYTGLAGNTVTCTDDFKFMLGANPLYGFKSTADVTATDEEGCIQVFENYNSEVILDVVLCAIDDSDVPTSCTITLQHRENPSLVMTWTSLTVA